MMRMPIKVASDVLPRWCRKIMPTVANPGALIWDVCTVRSESDTDMRAWFSKHVSGLTSGVTWKSTTSNRHKLADKIFFDMCRGLRPVIIDVGVSDGVTSLELIEKLAGNFDKFFVTDKTFELSYVKDEGRLYFYNEEGKCTIMSSKKLVIYADTMAWIPFRWIANRILRGAPPCVVPCAKKLRLMQPDLYDMARKDSRIIFREYDVFSTWPGPIADIIKVANLLNLDYFEETQIRKAIVNICKAVKEKGKVVVIDNRADGMECISIFKKSGGKLCLDRDVNGGCHTRDIILNI